LLDVVAGSSQRPKNIAARDPRRDGAAKVTYPHRAKKPTLRQAVNNIVTEGTFCDAGPDVTAKKNFAVPTTRHKAPQ